jgi:hypothetical protein
MTMIPLLFWAGAALAVEPAMSTPTPVVEVSTTAAVRYDPPQAPAHAQRLLQTAADVSRDLADTVAYLEAGQAYFRAFTRDTHTQAENQRLLEFLRDYEAELGTAKKEEAILRDWLVKAAALK